MPWEGLHGTVEGHAAHGGIGMPCPACCPPVPQDGRHSIASGRWMTARSPPSLSPRSAASRGSLRHARLSPGITSCRAATRTATTRASSQLSGRILPMSARYRGGLSRSTDLFPGTSQGRSRPSRRSRSMPPLTGLSLRISRCSRTRTATRCGTGRRACRAARSLRRRSRSSSGRYASRNGHGPVMRSASSRPSTERLAGGPCQPAVIAALGEGNDDIFADLRGLSGELLAEHVMGYESGPGFWGDDSFSSYCGRTWHRASKCHPAER